MKIREKVYLVCLITIFIMLIISKKSFAKSSDDLLCNFYVPDNYVLTDESQTENSTSKRYYNDIGNNNDYVFVDSSVCRYIEKQQPYTITDCNDYKKTIEESYKEDQYFTLTSIDGNLIEINGVKGFNIIYYLKDKENGKIVAYDRYFLVSDYCVANFDIYCPNYYINTTEHKKIINSFKIKDTVTVSKGIPFTDVVTNIWYFNAVKYVYNNGLIKGLNDYTFGPEDKLTRGMIVTILYRMEGSLAVTGDSGFTDVKSTEYYAKAVKWAKDKKIVQGYSGTTKFGPEDYILRQDLAGVLRNYARYKNKNVNVTASLTGFSDYKKIDSYANASMQWAIGTKVMNGNKDGTLNPKGNATRAETACMLKNYCEQVGK